MKKNIFLVVLILVIVTISNGQTVKISSDSFLKSRVDGLFYLSDSLLVNGVEELETEIQHLFISTINYNKKNNMLCIEGRVCESLDSNHNCNSGNPLAYFFVGKINKNILYDTATISKTAFNRSNFNLNGYFKLTINIKVEEYLFLASPNFYLQIFDIKKLLLILKN